MNVRSKMAVAATVAALIAPPAAALATPGGHGHSGSAPGSTVSQQHKHKGKSGSSSSTRMSAEKQCRAALMSMGKTAFDAKYGTNKNGRNAFGKCVSALAKAQHHQSSTP